VTERAGREVSGAAPYCDPRIPPGQRVTRDWPILHYGPVPKFRPDTWDLRIFGATASGDPVRWSFEDFQALPRDVVLADFHCVTKVSVLGNEWYGVLGSTVLAEVPPAPDVTHVMVWAEYGYSANIRLSDFAAEAGRASGGQPGHAVLATHRNGTQLSIEHGYPCRLIVPHLYAWKGPKWVRGIEYLTADRRGFWEERGYHNRGDPWREQRYSYQEAPGDGPAL
jgi:DMSO/TMAO reductase YedYZ molybdopterin-dependent catalytic subunit